MLFHYSQKYSDELYHISIYPSRKDGYKFRVRLTRYVITEKIFVCRKRIYSEEMGRFLSVILIQNNAGDILGVAARKIEFDFYLILMLI